MFNGLPLRGTRVSVEHSSYGVLFAAMTDGRGEIISDVDEEGNVVPWMTTDEILKQLFKFGFDITYTERLTLDEHILNYLMQLRNLGFDKVTKVNVMNRVEGSLRPKIYTLAIKSEYNSDMLTYGTTISQKRFMERLTSNYIMNIEDIHDSKLKWDWVDSIYNIDDILSENSEVVDFEVIPPEVEIPEDPAKPFTMPEYNSDLTPYDSTVVVDTETTSEDSEEDL